MTSAKDMRVVRLAGSLPAAELAAISASALDRPLTHSAELMVAVPGDAALVLGSMQRFAELSREEVGTVAAPARVLRRGSGGGEVAVGPGSVWVQLALARPGALVDCEPDRLLNRYVRPLLRALAKVGAVARYFDRDWVSVAGAPVAAVSFAHDATTGRALVEAFVAVTTPFAVRERGSFLGKKPLTLRESGAKHEVDAARVAAVVIEAYAAAYGIGELALDTASETTRDLPRDLAADRAGDASREPRNDPPWAAVRQEAIGLVGVGRDRGGRLRVGGELMASRDVIAQLEAEIAAAPADVERIDRAVDALAAPSVAMLGVRTLRSIRDAITEALAERGAEPH